MPESALTPQAHAVIKRYLHLPFATGQDVACPYFNNRTVRVRGALRALIGKGSPEDIAEEAMIFSLKEKTPLRTMDGRTLRQFLITHRLGVDCSAFAYYVLDAEVKARYGKSLSSCVRPSENIGMIRRILRRLRPVENTSVRNFADDVNTKDVQLSNIRAGDLIIFFNADSPHDRNHVLVVSRVGYDAPARTMIVTYAHSFRWTTDNALGHGVREGEIRVSDATSPIIEAHWLERGLSADQNETRNHARSANQLLIRRLKCLD